MKTNKILKIGLMAVGFMALFAVMYILNDLFAGLVSCAGVLLAVPPAGAPAGTPVTEPVSIQNVNEANENILDEDITKRITQIRPSATPLDTILQNVSQKQSTKSFVTRFFSSGVRDNLSIVKTGVAATAGGSQAKTHEVSLQHETFADTHDLLMFLDIAGSDGGDLVGHVVEKDLKGNVTIMLLNGTGDNHRDIPAIPEGTKVVRLSTAMNELTARGDDHAMVPSDDFNYCQIIMSTLTQGLYERDAAKKIDFNLNLLKDACLYDHRRKREGAALFGVREILLDPKTGKEIYHMGGIARTIQKYNSLSFDGQHNVMDTFIEITRHLFQDNNGADERYAFCGNNVLAWLAKGMAKDSVKNIEAMNTEIKYGIRFNKFESNFGTLLLRHHPDFASYGMDNKILIFDPEYINLKVRKPLGIRQIDNAKNGTELSETFVMEEAFTNEVTNPKVHAMVEIENVA